MSTIKTHTHTQKAPVGNSFFFCFCCCLLLFKFTSAAQHIQVEMKKPRRVADGISSSFSPSASVKCGTLFLNIDKIRRFERISLLLSPSPAYSRCGPSLSSDITVTSRILFQSWYSGSFGLVWIDENSEKKTKKKIMIPGCGNRV